MLPLSLRYVSRSNSRAMFFLSPLLLSDSPFSSSSSSYSTLCQARTESSKHRHHHLSFSPKDVVQSFKEWFNSRLHDTRHFDRIFEILRGDERAADAALSNLGLRLSEELVLRVLSHGKEDVLSCLKFFDWAAKQPGFHHSRATLYAIFKILSKAKLMSLMLDFLDNNVKPNCYKIRLSDTLVMGYAVAGKPDIALQLFGRMRFRGLDLDSFGYHVLLNALVEHSCFEAVDAIAQQISARGYECAATHSVLIKNFVKQNMLAEAEDHFRCLLRKDSNAAARYGLVFSLLVDGLCKNNMFEHASRLLEELGGMGILQMEHAYGVWLKALVRAGRLDDALFFLQTKSCLEGYVPHVFQYNFLVCRLLRQNRLQDVCDTLIEMRECDILPDKVTMNAVLCFFCKAGMVDVALELYNSRSGLGITPNSMAYNYLINTLCSDGSLDEAYLILRNSIDQGHFPGRKTFNILVDASCRQGKLDKMKELVLVALERNLMPSKTTYDRFISALCKATRVEDAYLIHGELSRINVATTRNMYYNLISGFNNAGRGDISARLLIEMQEKGHKPTRPLFRAVICCLCSMASPEIHFFNLLKMQLSQYERNCQVYNFFIDGAGHAGRPELAREVYDMMGTDGIEPNNSSDILMLQSYVKNERVSDALNFVAAVRQRRPISSKLYNAIVVGLCKVNKADLALCFLQEIREKGQVPSAESYEVLIQNLCSNDRYETAVNVIHDFVKTGRRITSYMGNIILYNALKTPALYEAWIQLKDVQNEKPEIALLGQLIGVFSGRVSMMEPIEELEEVIEKCFPLDTYTYNLLMRRLSMRQLDHACEMFERMFWKGYEPNRWTYDILVQGLFKNGRTEEANKWLELMFRKGFDLTDRTKLLV